MNCNQARTLLTPWLDDELDARSTAEIQAHLQACAACQARFESESRVEQRVAEHLHDGAMPELVWERLQAGLGRGAVLRWPWMAAAAALVVVSLSLIWFYRPEPFELFRQQVAAHRERVDDAIPGALAADMLAPITAFLSGRETGWSPPEPGLHGLHQLEWVDTEATRIGVDEALSMRVTCCGSAITLFLMDASVVASFPAELAATINKGESVQATVDGVTTNTFRDGGVLVSIVSEHDTDIGGK
jgi:hypothetical protein